MKKGTLVCSFSGVYEAQGFIQWLNEVGAGARVLEMSDLEGTNCYCDPVAASEICKRLVPIAVGKSGEEGENCSGLEGKNGSQGENCAGWEGKSGAKGVNCAGLGCKSGAEGEFIRWIDSGDYHYMTHLLAKMEKEPFHLLLLDNHPDNQETAFGGDILSCGSWVKAMREENRNLKDVLWIGPENGEYQSWLEARRGERLYVSLDKDVMSKDYARTDWTQGNYSLEQIEQVLIAAMTEMNVVAIDICGEIAESKGATPTDNRINFETNKQLYKLVTQFSRN